MARQPPVVPVPANGPSVKKIVIEGVVLRRNIKEPDQVLLMETPPGAVFDRDPPWPPVHLSLGEATDVLREIRRGIDAFLDAVETELEEVGD